MLHDNPSKRNDLSHGYVFPEPAQEGNPRQRSFSLSEVLRLMEYEHFEEGSSEEANDDSSSSWDD